MIKKICLSLSYWFFFFHSIVRYLVLVRARTALDWHIITEKRSLWTASENPKNQNRLRAKLKICGILFHQSWRKSSSSVTEPMAICFSNHPNSVHFFVKYENRIRDFAEKSHASILTNHLFAFKDYFKERCFSLVSLHHVLPENRQNLRRFERVF